MKIEIIFTDDDDKKYGKGFIFDKNTLPKLDKCGKSSQMSLLYKLVKMLADSMREREDIPIFTDLKREMDGSILSCSFIIDKERHNEWKLLEKMAQ